MNGKLCFDQKKSCYDEKLRTLFESLMFARYMYMATIPNFGQGICFLYKSKKPDWNQIPQMVKKAHFQQKQEP